jgi:hypothetical protein
MSSRGGSIDESALIRNFNPLLEPKPVRPVSKPILLHRKTTNQSWCRTSNLGVGLPQVFPRVSKKSLHTTQAH